MSKRILQQTDWFDSIINPVRRGFYRVRNNPAIPRTRGSELTGSLRYWSGKQWFSCWGTTKEDERYPTIFGKYPGHQWAGLTT